MTHTLIRVQHSATIDRRTTLRWLAAALAAAGPLAACGETPSGLVWPVPQPLTGKGYGKDPSLQHPTAPWPLTLTPAELAACAAVCDLILPAEGDAPSASGVGVPAFVDEWVSAPYPSQQEQRAVIVPGLAWLDAEAKRRGGDVFARVDLAHQHAIADDIAFAAKVKPGLEKPAEFFKRMRALTLGAYYTTPQGWKAIGYQGFTPTGGAYPGPTPEALAHIKGVIETMGLRFAPV